MPNYKIKDGAIIVAAASSEIKETLLEEYAKAIASYKDYCGVYPYIGMYISISGKQAAIVNRIKWDHHDDPKELWFDLVAA